MHTEFLMGNEALALGALSCGVNLVAGYPGTPSTEVLETVAKRKRPGTYVEWSTNEKAALEVAAGAAYAGARTLVTCKQVGLNVASDPLMSLAYIGVKGGMVVLVADDPGPISSQTEQDTRTFGRFSKIPVFDPSSVEEAYRMMREAFALSEREHTPVIVRPTTRIDHGYEAIGVSDEDEWETREAEGFVKDSSKWVIFPRLSVANHAKIEERNDRLASEFSHAPYDAYNYVSGQAYVRADGKRVGLATGGINYAYAVDALDDLDVKTLKVGTPFPFPAELARDFMADLDEVLCIEEFDPVIEERLKEVAGTYHLPCDVYGKKSGHMPRSGENTCDSVRGVIFGFLGKDAPVHEVHAAPPTLPVRPPVLCAGCPHRASFLAVKEAMRLEKTIYCGDIGCYTLGNARPLDMCDTCLCMGAGITIAQGVGHVEPDTRCFAFVGDSTFFASGITGVVNAYYNQANLTVMVLDNSTTAMTGHQPHPGTGRTMMGQVVDKVSIENVLSAIGLTTVETIDPLDQQQAIATVRRVAAEPGVKAIICKSPCVVLAKPQAKSTIDANTCIACGRCIKELGCPALYWKDGKAAIDETQCTGCTLCEQTCPVHAISGGERL